MRSRTIREMFPRQYLLSDNSDSDRWLPSQLTHMYSMDDLLHVVHSDGADALRLQVGKPPVIILEGEPQTLEGPALTAEDTEHLLRSIADTRQRRELRENGGVEFIWRFRRRASFVVRATIKSEQVGIEIH